MLGKKNTYSKNYFFHTMYQVFSLLTPLITTPYVSRVLLPEGIGRYSYAFTMVQYFILVGNLGFSTYGQVQIARESHDSKRCAQTFWEIFFVRAGVFIATSLAYLVFIFWYDSDVKLYVVLFGLMLSGIIDISWFYFGLNDFKSVSLRNVLVKVIGIVGIFVFVRTRDDVELYALILTGSTLLGSVIMWPNIKAVCAKPVFSELQFKKHLKPAIQYFLPNIATTVYSMVDKTMIGIITDSEAQNGFYEQAHKIEQMIVQFLLSISVVYRTEMAVLFAEKNEEAIHNNIDNALRNILFLSFPMCFGLIAISDNLVGWFLGLEYLACIPMLQVFSVLLIIISVSNSMSNMYMTVTNLHGKFVIATYLSAATNILCNLLLIPMFGALGAAIASVISETVLLVYCYYYSRKYYSIRKHRGVLLKYSFACIVMLVIIRIESMFLQPYTMQSVFIEVATGVVVYVGLLAVMRDQTLFSYLNKVMRIIPFRKKRKDHG